MVNIITGYTVNKESFAGLSFCYFHSNYFTLHWTGTFVFYDNIIAYSIMRHICACA